MLRRARRARCASLGFLLLAATVAVHLPCTVRAMTVSGISPNLFGSFGGVRLTVSGSGFGDPFARPAVVLGADTENPVAECVVIPYLSTETRLVCDTTPARNFPGVFDEFGRLNGRRELMPLHVLDARGTAAKCIYSGWSVPCGVFLNHDGYGKDGE